jgi:hypothetical protein
MKKWRIDIFFQFSHSTQLYHKEAATEKAPNFVLDMVPVNLPFLPKPPTYFPRLSHHIYLHLHKSSTIPVFLAFGITAVSSQL